MNALTVADYEELAGTRLEPPIWDFLTGGAGEERTLAANTAAFDRVLLRPTVLRGAVDPELTTKILGETWAAPLGIAPVALHALAHPEGELASARAAGRAGIPMCVSTMASREFAEIAAVADGPLWLQLYCFRDRSRTLRLVERAEQAGYGALVLTVDTPHLGRRLRDLRNDFRLPPDVAAVNLEAGFTSPAAHARSDLDPALDWSVVSWLRSISTLPLLVKGILTAQDAMRAVDAGVDGIVVSNHGGRQLDGVPATFQVLAEITAAVAGRCPVLVDGGIRRGRDILACLAAGADAALIGRPALYGLAVDGAEGLTHVLDILLDELRDAMTLTGMRSLADIGPELISK